MRLKGGPAIWAFPGGKDTPFGCVKFLQVFFKSQKSLSFTLKYFDAKKNHLEIVAPPGY